MFRASPAFGDIGQCAAPPLLIICIAGGASSPRCRITVRARISSMRRSSARRGGRHFIAGHGLGRARRHRRNGAPEMAAARVAVGASRRPGAKVIARRPALDSFIAGASIMASLLSEARRLSCRRGKPAGAAHVCGARGEWPTPERLSANVGNHPPNIPDLSSPKAPNHLTIVIAASSAPIASATEMTSGEARRRERSRGHANRRFYRNLRPPAESIAPSVGTQQASLEQADEPSSLSPPPPAASRCARGVMAKPSRARPERPARAEGSRNIKRPSRGALLVTPPPLAAAGDIAASSCRRGVALQAPRAGGRLFDQCTPAAERRPAIDAAVGDRRAVGAARRHRPRRRRLRGERREASLRRRRRHHT